MGGFCKPVMSVGFACLSFVLCLLQCEVNSEPWVAVFTLILLVLCYLDSWREGPDKPSSCDLGISGLFHQYLYWLIRSPCCMAVNSNLFVTKPLSSSWSSPCFSPWWLFISRRGLSLKLCRALLPSPDFLLWFFFGLFWLFLKGKHTQWLYSHPFSYCA